MVITDVNQVVYNGDGINTAWPFTFPIIDYTDLKLTLINAAGARTDITSDYYVDMVNNTVYYPGYAPGAEPPEANQPPKVQSGEKLEIYRRVPVNQLADLGEKWPFNVIEKGLDKLTMICQDIYSWISRNILGLAEGELAWDAKNFPIHNVGGPVDVNDAATKDYVDKILSGIIESGDGRIVPYDTVAQMRGGELVAGQIAATLGYYDINDGGHAVYAIRAAIPGDADDGGSIIILDNGNVAELITDGTVNAKQFGAYGDDTHDDTTAIQNFFAFQADKHLFIPGTYKCTDSITVNKDIVIDGNGALLKFTSGYLTFTGSMGDYISVTTSIAQGDDEITVTAPSIGADDVILLLDDTDYSYSKHRDYYKLGDILRVEENTGTKLKLYERVTHIYDSADDLKIAKLNVIKVNIQNLSVEATNANSLYALRMFCCVDSVVKNVHTKYGKYASLDIEMSLDVDVDDANAYQEYSGSGLDYGIALIESKNIYVQHSTFYGIRHAVAIGTNGRGICRNITIDGCELDNNFATGNQVAADIHGAAYNTIYKNNIINNGVGIGGDYAKYINNTIYAPSGNHCGVFLVEAVGGEFQIENNIIIMPTGNTHAYVVDYYNATSLSKISYSYRFTLKNNTIALKSSQTHLCHFATNDTATNVKPVFEVSGNYVRDNTTNLVGLVKYDGGSTIAPAEIIFRDFIQGSITLSPYFLLLDVNSGILTGCKLEFPVEVYRVAVNVLSGSYKGDTYANVRYRPTTAVINNVSGNFATPLSASVRERNIHGSSYVFATADFDSAATGFTVVVTTGSSAQTIDAATFYTDVYVGGIIVP